MKEMLLLKCGELVLKGLNRRRFENRLFENLRARLARVGNYSISAMQSTFYIEAEDGADITAAYDVCAKTFGFNSISRAAVCEKDFEKIKQCAVEYLGGVLSAGAPSIKVCAKRSDKRFPMNSPQICAALGEYLFEYFPNLRADMENPDIVITVEIRDRHAFIHALKQPAAGGMPVGSSGRAMLLLSGGIDSPVAGYMMARRGLALSAVHFFSYPYTSEQARDKVIELARILTAYTDDIRLFLVPFTKVQEQMRKSVDSELFTVIMRRIMMRIACELASNDKCGALITGESLGQVASQTMQAIAATEQAATIPIFRPLIGTDKEEIVRTARKIGTFETSILPYEDCCTVFTPKHPVTKPRLDKVLLNEGKLDVEGLCREAVAATELMHICG